mgnify:CR=1 FL=1
MYIQQIYTDCLAQASYYIESQGEAIIIDPIRDSEPYLQFLKERNAKLKYIFETHFHADFVSGHIELAKLTSADIVFGPNADTSYNCIVAADGQEFFIGDFVFRALHTPGHTMESTCYLLLSKDQKELAVFTGDTLFIGEVGRPDLAVNPTLTSADLAKNLYNSLHNILMELPDDVVVYPGHGAGSACGKNISLEKQSTIGEQKKFNYALQPMSQDQFVKIVLDGISLAPEYFTHDVNMNKNGYESVSSVLTKSLKQLTVNEIEKLVNNGAIILDVRLPNDFEKGFIPSAINIGKAGMFAPWVATLIAPSQKVILVCNINEEKEVISRLARVGLENIIGYVYGVKQWLISGKPIDVIESITAAEMEIEPIDSKILDVRKPSELAVGFVKGSSNVPLDTLQKELDTTQHLDARNQPILVYCAGGYRSMIASSILKARGYKKVKNIYGGYSSISQNQKC